MSGFALFAERRFEWNGHPFGPREVGYVYAYVGVLAIILQGGLIGRLVERFGEWRLVRAGFLLSAIGYAALGFTSTVPLLLAVSLLTSFGGGVLRPALTSLITQQASRSEQGSVLGLTQSLMSISSILAPLLAGILIDHRQLVAWAFVPAVCSALGLLLPKPGTAAVS
jgi:MFS family permease